MMTHADSILTDADSIINIKELLLKEILTTQIRKINVPDEIY